MRRVLKGRAGRGAVWAALFSLCACAAATDPVLVQVGEARLYRPDVEEAAGRLFEEGVRLDSLNATERETLYRALVIGELLTLEGRARGYDQSEEILQALRKQEADLLVQVYARRRIDEKVEVSPADIEARYREWGSGEERRMGHILLQTEAKADSLLGRLAAGDSFADLARAHSLHTESAPRGGDMGFLLRVALPGAIAERAWDTPPGQVYPRPVRSPMGYHLVRVEQRRVRALAELEPQIRNRLLGEKTRERRRLVLEELQRDYKARWRAEVAARMAAREALPADQALYRWDGGELRAADYLRRAKARQPVYRDTARLRLEAWRLVADDLMVQDARRRGWDQLPEVKRPLQHTAAKMMAVRLFQVEGQQAAADSVELRRFYQENRQAYRGPPRLHVREILVDTQATADSLHGLIEAGADMADLARRHTRRAVFKENGGLWRDVEAGNPLGAKIYRLASQGEGLLPPIKVPGGYSLVRVLGKEEGLLLSYDEAKEAVENDLSEIKMDEFLQSLEAKYSTEIKTTPF